MRVCVFCACVCVCCIFCVCLFVACQITQLSLRIIKIYLNSLLASPHNPTHPELRGTVQLYSGSYPPNCWRGIFTLVPTPTDVWLHSPPRTRVLLHAAEYSAVPSSILMLSTVIFEPPSFRRSEGMDRRRYHSCEMKWLWRCTIVALNEPFNWNGCDGVQF
jgi:hypothetical protein